VILLSKLSNHPQATSEHTISSEPYGVSVVTATYNRSDFLTEALDSVIVQTTPERIEIVVVDDGSIDHTKQVIEPYTKRFNDPAGKVIVRYIYQENQGVAAARNTGIANTTAPYIAFLDDDDMFEPNKLELQLKAMRDDPGVSLSHTSFRYVDKDGGFCDEGPQRVDNPCVGSCVDVLLNELLVICSTVMVRRTTLEQAAAAEPHGLPYDSRMVRWSEDYDLTLRMARLGRFAYIPESMLRYRLHDSNISMSEGNIKQAYAYHCQVQIDFVRRYGHELGIDETEAKRRAAAFLFGRAESAFWQREFPKVKDVCDLAREMGLYDERFADLNQKSSRPAWIYKVKDRVDQILDNK